MSKDTNGVKLTPKDETAVKSDTVKAQNAKPPIESNPKPELSNLVVKGKTETADNQQPEKKLRSIEERLLKIDELNDLVDKRESIVEALKNVTSFYISPAGNAHLKFQDSKGITFGIAHPSVIGEMVAMAAAKLNAELTAIDKKIDFQF